MISYAITVYIDNGYLLILELRELTSTLSKIS